MKHEKVYNKAELAKKLNVHYQTVNYWIKKGWIKPRRDYRNYPVFTEQDINNIIKWKNKLKGRVVQ
jgi:DNA-binding transcriptional MerR regulator